MQPQNILRPLVNYLIPAPQPVNNQPVILQRPSVVQQQPVVSFHAIPVQNPNNSVSRIVNVPVQKP